MQPLVILIMSAYLPPARKSHLWNIRYTPMTGAGYPFSMLPATVSS